jgi:penicillin-binding protein 1A
MIFNLPSVVVSNDLDTQFKRYMLDHFIDDLEILTLLSDAPKGCNLIETFRTQITRIAASQKVEGALIAVEPATGYITSMVGGTGFEGGNQFNRSVQAQRQPGSAFKPFVYGAAINSKSITTATVLFDGPLVDVDTSGTKWAPVN